MSAVAGIARTTWSKLERADGADVSILVWVRAARAAGGDLRAYVDGATAADQPRDAAHLRAQELIVTTSASGGWQAHPERAIDLDPRRSRAADLVLVRNHEVALVEVYDWLPDVGDAFRGWDRKLATMEARTIARPTARVEPSTIRASGIWVLRATVTNRRLVAEHRALFRARFPGSAVGWLACLTRTRSIRCQPPRPWSGSAFAVIG